MNSLQKTKSPITDAASLIAPADRGNEENHLGDLRFRSLVGQNQWQKLPKAVRCRFSKRLSEGATAVYTGNVTQARTSWVGHLLAQLTRIIGSPLPRHLCIGATATVTVCEDCQRDNDCWNGQFWTRIYGRKDGFPQVIHSVKRFNGPTGLEEYIGRGIGMALDVDCESDGIRFSSDHYFLQFGKWRYRLPAWLSPGTVVVRHVDKSHGQFVFTLELNHPWFGELMYQEILFSDMVNEHQPAT